MKKRLESPIVVAVRKVRRDLAKKCDYDLHKLADLMRREETAYRRRKGQQGGRGQA